MRLAFFHAAITLHAVADGARGCDAGVAADRGTAMAGDTLVVLVAGAAHVVVALAVVAEWL